MTADLLAGLGHSGWLLPALFALVLLDALLVVVPGEVAVSALGALSVSVGAPPLAAVIAVASAAALTGDALCFLVGRRVGVERWRWMRTGRVRRAVAWARGRLDRSTAAVVFTARFVPFARLAVNLTAGATGVGAVRYLALAAGAATAWGVYQAVVGAAVAALLPDAPALAVVVSVVVALVLGIVVDRILAARARVTGARRQNGVMTSRIAMPARLSDADGADARVGLANAIFDDVAALVRAEGLDVVVVRDTDLSGFDGLVLPGGGDVDPARYGGDPSAPCYDVNAAQDELDLGILAAAIERGLPVLGVCRGLQVVNVALGGTLVEDLAPGAVRHTPGTDGCGELEWTWHPVAVAAGSRLRDEMDADEIPVASGHHQAIRALGTGLVATAVAPDGVVEAVEHESLPIIAVQWHPEAEGTPADLAAAPFAAFASLVRAGRLAAR